ncbi:MAG: AraC family transcriptional regulator [Gammaproteobacteria bacterium]|nr:MAG: AraC family transcriptional regulator [Gammaproteobacteria bacterium]
MKTPIFNFHDLILVLTLSVCLLLVIFQLLLSKQKVIASRLLSLFFICVGVSALCNLLLWNNYLHIESAFAKASVAWGISFALVGKSVFLYLYVVSITRENFRFESRQWLHFINFIVVIGLLLVGALDSERLRFTSPTQTAFSISLVNDFWHYLKMLPVVYAISAVWVASHYKKQLKEFYSSLSLDGPQWLMLLTLGFAINWSWSLAVHIIGQTAGTNTADSFGILDNYITFILVNALFVYSLLYAHQLLEPKNIVKEKVAVAVDEPAPELIARIQNGMDGQQLYLKQNLNIEEFAKHVGIHYREVSAIINKHFNTNFFEFVNSYRVKRAQEMLLDPAYAEMTILDILLESGFNSKSAFHRFFKRYTGMSAAEYRKQKSVSDTASVVNAKSE